MYKIKLLIKISLFSAILIFANSATHIQTSFAKNPFKSNKNLKQYIEECNKVTQSKNPAYLEIISVDNREKEDVYQYLREQITKPIPAYQLILLDYPQLRLLRNEIYARHGYIFGSEDLETYFDAFDWYKPDPQFDESRLSNIEQDNISLMKRLEYIKFNKNLLTPMNKSNFLAVRDIEDENDVIKVTEESILFKATGKQIALSRHYIKREDGHNELVNYQTVSAFDTIPIIFVRNWEREFLVTGSSSGAGIAMYDTHGDLIGNIAGGGGEIYYIPEMDAFITISNEGCCGSTWGSSLVFDRKGTILFSFSYGYDGGGGAINYFMPHWSSSVVAFIYGNRTEKFKKTGVPDTNSRLCIFGKGGELISDIELDSDRRLPYELDQIVFVTPDVLYISGKNKKAFVLTNKDSPFNPKTDNLYHWKNLEYSEKDLDGGCSPLDKKIAISPIFNPKSVWEKTVQYSMYYGGREKLPLITEDTLVFAVNDAPNGLSTIIAIDKLTGKEKWRYRTFDNVRALSYLEDSLVVRGREKMIYLNIANGNLVWEKVSSTLGWIKSLLLKEKWIIEELYSPGGEKYPEKGHIVNIYELNSGEKIKSLNLSHEFLINKDNQKWWINHTISSNYGCFTISSNLISYTIFREAKDARKHMKSHINRRLFIASINNNGSIVWKYETPLDYWTYPYDKTPSVQIANCNIYIIDGYKITILDPASGKILYQGKLENDGLKIRPNKLKVVQNRFAWSEYELGLFSYFYSKDKRILGTFDPTCLNNLCLKDYVYIEELYDERFRKGVICLAYPCKKGGYHYGGRIWEYAPPDKEKGFKGNPKIIHVDNHFLIVQAGRSFWAIGEEALYDYLVRKGELDNQVMVLSP